MIQMILMNNFHVFPQIKIKDQINIYMYFYISDFKLYLVFFFQFLFFFSNIRKEKMV